ncbi:MAG: MFS transporter [Nitrospinota bacterium]
MSAGEGEAGNSSFKTLPWTATGIIFLAHFVVDSQANFVAPLLPLLREKFGFSLAMAGLLISLQSVGGSLTQPLAAVFTDRWPWMPWLAIGMVGSAIAFTAIGWVPSFVLVVIAIPLGAIFFALAHPDMAARAGRLSSAHASLIVSMFVTAGRLGFALGPLMAIAVADTLGMEWLWIYIVVSLVTWRLIVSGLPAPPRPGSGKKEKNVREGLLSTLMRVRGPILLLFGVAAARSLAAANLGGFLPTIFVDEGLGLWRGGFANTVFYVAGATGVMVGGIFGDRTSKHTVIKTGMGIGLVGMVGFLVFPLTWAYVFLASAGMGLFMPMGVSVALAQEYMPEHRGFASSFILGAGTFLAGLSSMPIAMLGQQVGLLNAFWVIPVFLVAGVACAISLPKKENAG